jgi:L-threonylcarbamoyladenylate synthase
MGLNKTANILCSGGMAVILTDTIYGVVGCTLNKITVNKIYLLKNRAPAKPCIILISNPNQMLDFGVKPSWLNKTAKYWPGPNSLIVPTHKKDIDYLTRGSGTLAFRLPNKPDLIALINKTGTLIAPSANPEGLEPAKTIAQAKKYFGKEIDIYVDGGDCSKALASKLIDLRTNKILR